MKFRTNFYFLHFKINNYLLNKNNLFEFFYFNMIYFDFLYDIF
jgi:hypothetical protein